MKAGTGVVIGRFQIHRPTLGHMALIAKAAHHKDLLILVGVTGGQPTGRNPLSFEVRKRMLLEYVPDADIRPVQDLGDDIRWSQRIDALIESAAKGPVIIYAGRDSFLEHYHGLYDVETIPTVVGHSGTSLRELIGAEWGDTYRAGLIDAAKGRYPTMYSTVDIALRKNGMILLGQKEGESRWRFPGGFVDPSDQSLTLAASRELHEETGRYDSGPYKFIGSTKVDDFRYRGSADGIMTSLFLAEFACGPDPEASDDLARIRFFDVENLMSVITDSHRPLVRMLWDHLGYEPQEDDDAE